MRRYDSLVTNPSLVNLGHVGYQFVSLQLSYSTAEIGRTIFFGPIHTTIEMGEQIGKATVLVVQGDISELEEQASPGQSTPTQ